MQKPQMQNVKENIYFQYDRALKLFQIRTGNLLFFLYNTLKSNYNNISIFTVKISSYIHKHM